MNSATRNWPGWLGGDSRFELVGGPEFFTNLMQGYSSQWQRWPDQPGDQECLQWTFIADAGFYDTVTWVKGTHTF
jgi:hypothetical protein